MINRIIAFIFALALGFAPVMAKANQTPSIHLDLGGGLVNQQNPSTGNSSNIVSGTAQVTVDVTKKLAVFGSGSYNALTRTPSAFIPSVTFATPTWQVGTSLKFSPNILGTVQYGTVVNNQLLFPGESRVLNQLEASLWTRVF